MSAALFKNSGGRCSGPARTRVAAAAAAVRLLALHRGTQQHHGCTQETRVQA